MPANRDSLNLEFGKLKVRASGRLAVVAALILGAVFMLPAVRLLILWWTPNGE